MTIRMKSLKAHTYAGKRLKAGQEFDARGESDKRVLVAIKAADVVPASTVAAPALQPEPLKPRAYVRRDQSATEPQASAPAEQPIESGAESKPRRVYRRRDQVAE